jgi:hypothetical protein
MEPSTLNLDSFSPKKAELTALATELAHLEDLTIVDKKTYELVHIGHMKLADARITTEKQGKTLREDALAFQRKVLEREKELLSEITPLEDTLKAKKKAYNDEQDRIKKEEIDRKERILNDRMYQLHEYGQSDFDIARLRDLSDDLFHKLLADTKQEFEEAEIVRKKKEDDERIEREQFLADQKKLEDDRRAFAEEQRIARQVQVDKDRAAQLEQARLQGIKDAEDQAKRDALQAEINAREAQAKLEKKKKYKEFCDLHGYAETSKDSFRMIPE